MKMKSLAFPPLLGLFVLACSPPADPIGKAAAHYQVDFPRSPNVEGQCNQTAEAAVAQDSSTTPELPIAQSEVLPTYFGEPVSDGEENDISCKVAPLEDGSYKIEVELLGPNVSETAGNAFGNTSLTITNATMGPDGTGSARVVLRTTQTEVLEPNLPCELKGIPDKEVIDAYQIRAGEARFVFTCPSTTSTLDDFSICETRGTVWVRNCVEKP